MAEESLSAWLAVREGADSAARSAVLTRSMVDRGAALTPIRVLDLGAGTGSNFRFLAPRLGTSQQWLLVDHDPRLLQEAKTRAAAAGYAGTCEIETRTIDLDALDDPGIFAGRHLVTASALLDLVSEQWLATLASRCRAVGAGALFPLNYNGRSRCTPAEPEDEEVRALMNRHQRSDKGLGGVAAGPDAADCARRCFLAEGYQVRVETSDWILGPELRELQSQLVEGWAHAARELVPGQRSWIENWLARRLAHVAAGRSHVVVGHDDVAAWLSARPPTGPARGR
jgi:SAM-dependent methyltransferase